MISWPCILKLAGDDELLYLAAEQDFFAECRDLIFSDDDTVIDSAGCSYFIRLMANKLVLIKQDRLVVLDEITTLIRAHAFKNAEVCLTKIHFLTLSAAIRSLLY